MGRGDCGGMIETCRGGAVWAEVRAGRDMLGIQDGGWLYLSLPALLSPPGGPGRTVHSCRWLVKSPARPYVEVIKPN